MKINYEIQKRQEIYDAIGLEFTFLPRQPQAKDKEKKGMLKGI